MFNRSFISVLITTSAFTLAFGQTPEVKKEKAAAPQTFAFPFDGNGGYLGVQTVEVTKENFSKYNMSGVRGVAVEKVLENSPAQSAGLQTGDVIVRFDGEEIASVRKLTRLISEVGVDHQVKLTISRNGSEQEISATLGKRPMPGFANGTFGTPMPLSKVYEMPEMPAMPSMPDMPRIMTTAGADGRAFAWRAGGGRQIGVGVTALTKQLASHYGLDGGLLINDVRENSPAAKAGLKAGDIIVEADGKAVKGDFDLIRMLHEKKEGDISVTYVRSGNRQTVNVTPEAAKDGGFIFQTVSEGGIPPMPALA